MPPRPGGLVVVSEIDAGTIFLGASDSDVVHLLEAQLNTAFPNGRVRRHLHRMLAASGLVDVRCVPVVVLNTVAFVRMVIGNRLTGLVEAGATTAAAAEAFWAEQAAGRARRVALHRRHVLHRRRPQALIRTMGRPGTCRLARPLDRQR